MTRTIDCGFGERVRTRVLRHVTGRTEIRILGHVAVRADDRVRNAHPRGEPTSLTEKRRAFRRVHGVTPLRNGVLEGAATLVALHAEIRFGAGRVDREAELRLVGRAVRIVAGGAGGGEHLHRSAGRVVLLDVVAGNAPRGKRALARMAPLAVRVGAVVRHFPSGGVTRDAPFIHERVVRAAVALAATILCSRVSRDRSQRIVGQARVRHVREPRTVAAFALHVMILRRSRVAETSFGIRTRIAVLSDRVTGLAVRLHGAAGGEILPRAGVLGGGPLGLFFDVAGTAHRFFARFVGIADKAGGAGSRLRVVRPVAVHHLLRCTGGCEERRERQQRQ